MDINQITGSVLHVVSAERAVNYRWEKDSKNLPSNLQIVSIDDLKSFPESVIKERFCDYNINIGTVLVLEPYTRKYIEISKSEEIFFKSRFDVISTIASFLGVVRMSTELRVRSYKKRTLNANCEVEYKSVKGGSEFTNRKEKELRSYYRDELTSHSPIMTDTDEYKTKRRIGYEMAQKFIQDHGLEHDSEIMKLMIDRNPDHPFPQESRSYSFNISNDINDRFDAAFKLRILPGIFKLDSNVQTETESIYEAELTTHMVFNS